jgi:hypothetical protein
MVLKSSKINKYSGGVGDIPAKVLLSELQKIENLHSANNLNPNYLELKNTLLETRIALPKTGTLKKRLGSTIRKATRRAAGKQKTVSLFKECVKKLKGKMNAEYYDNNFGKRYLADFNDENKHVIHYNNGNVYIISFDGLNMHIFYEIYFAINALAKNKPVDNLLENISNNGFLSLKDKQLDYILMPQKVDDFIMRHGSRGKLNTLSDLEYELIYYKNKSILATEKGEFISDFNHYMINGKNISDKCFNMIIEKLETNGFKFTVEGFNIIITVGTRRNHIKFYYKNKLSHTLALINFFIQCELENKCNQTNFKNYILNSSYYKALFSRDTSNDNNEAEAIVTEEFLPTPPNEDHNTTSVPSTENLQKHLNNIRGKPSTNNNINFNGNNNISDNNNINFSDNNNNNINFSDNNNNINFSDNNSNNNFTNITTPFKPKTIPKYNPSSGQVRRTTMYGLTPKTLRGKTDRKTVTHTKRRGLTPTVYKALSKVKETRKQLNMSERARKNYLSLKQFIFSNRIRNADLNRKMREINKSMSSSSPDYDNILSKLANAFKLAKSLKK